MLVLALRLLPASHGVRPEVFTPFHRWGNWGPERRSPTAHPRQQQDWTQTTGRGSRIPLPTEYLPVGLGWRSKDSEMPHMGPQNSFSKWLWQSFLKFSFRENGKILSGAKPPQWLFCRMTSALYFRTTTEQKHIWNNSDQWINPRLKEKAGEDFPGGPVVKNPPANAGDTGSIPGPGKFQVLSRN